MAATTTSRRVGLDRADVVQCALDMVEVDGADALSMRKLAAELDVTTTTIYWHVGNREQLVIAVIRRLAGQQAEIEVVGSTPKDRVLSAARNIWSNALAHRHVTALAGQVGASTLLELPLEVTLAAELEAAGVRGEAARDALRSILMCTAGFLIGAWRTEDRIPTELRRSSLWAAVDDQIVSGPTIAAMADPPDLDQLFDTTIGAVIEAVLADVSTRTGMNEGDMT